MALDGEPKDGDFVRYIEMLNRQAGATPGEILQHQRPTIKLSLRKSAEGRATTDESVYTYAPARQTSAPSYSPGSTRNDDTAESTTLAMRSGQRHLSLALGIAAAIALLSALHKLLTAINTDTLGVDTLLPLIFLLVCAGMLFKGAHGARQKQAKPLPQLPPLTTIHMGRKPKS